MRITYCSRWNQMRNAEYW